MLQPAASGKGWYCGELVVGMGLERRELKRIARKGQATAATTHFC